MLKPRLKSHPPDGSAEVNVAQHSSLVDLLELSYEKYAVRDAAVCMGSRLKFRDVDRMSTALAAWLQARGLAPGARVAIMLPNVLQYMPTIAAILRAGCVVVTVNPLYTPRELQHQLKDSGAEAIFILKNFARTLEQVVGDTSARHVVLASIGDLVGFAKGHVVNFVVRNVKKIVPDFRLPPSEGRTVTRFIDAVPAGSRLTLQRPKLGPECVAFLQ